MAARFTWECSFCGRSSVGFLSSLARDEDHDAHLKSCEPHNAAMRAPLSPADRALLDEALRYCADDQLRAETARRGIEASATLGCFTDAELRAECERRKMAVVNIDGSVGTRYFANWTERERIEAECDEWKRRAEAAEKIATWCQRCTGTGELGYAGPVCPACHGSGHFTRPFGEAPIGALAESGPGIAAKPVPQSEPLAFLDEDLLCEDAR